MSAELDRVKTTLDICLEKMKHWEIIYDISNSDLKIYLISAELCIKNAAEFIEKLRETESRRKNG